MEILILTLALMTLAPEQQTNKVYLPLIVNQAPAAKPTACHMDHRAATFADMLRGSARQQRGSLTCDTALVRAAERRARSMAEGDYFGHCDPAGDCPNRYALRAGCRLPAHYPQNGNSVESITAGSLSARASFDALARSPGHASHLFGLGDFYGKQTRIGIAVAESPGSKYGAYWSIMIAECE